MKTYVLTLSKHFMQSHPKAGQATEFFLKVKAGVKKHTIRGNYELWKKRIDAINSGKAILSLREWSGKPYSSGQVELLQLSKVGLQKLELTPIGWFIDDIESEVRTKEIASNDGLSLEDFGAWFSKGTISKEPMAIIHFSDFRY